MNRLMICAAALLLGACGDKSVAGPAIDTDLDPSQATAAAGPAVSPEARSFRDWRAQCDNGNVCAAFGPSTAGTGGWIRVTREPGATARPGVVFGLRGDSGSDIPGPLTVKLDGKTYAAAAGAPDTAAFVLSDADAADFLTRLPNSRALTISAGDVSLDLSVTGASAALLWIDERQGRLDTVTAVVRKGDRPASAVTAAPALPLVVAAAAVSQQGFEQYGSRDANGDTRSPPLPAAVAAMPAARSCQADVADNEYLSTAFTVARLATDTELWGVPCFGGAYNMGYRYFTTGVGGTNPQPVSFPTSDGSTFDVINGQFDPATRILDSFEKGRGLGDCGTASAWVWTGRAFALKTEQHMEECWGMVSDYWPTTWRTR
ncbi:DUF1176 domain-containing protein [Brevundimonas sp.]|uniref:DUF1176 domain-containing protein n=1 Tax=Brevundimonas sp. TaxID=1871086 RepID=UPI002486DA2E|nr:DUF1176 domain-containing protein [Brevundimonas sp.]MDI1281213.1 DUF1176 domain-containing protein [Brevundimonas sp.]